MFKNTTFMSFSLHKYKITYVYNVSTFLSSMLKLQYVFVVDRILWFK